MASTSHLQYYSYYITKSLPGEYNFSMTFLKINSILAELSFILNMFDCTKNSNKLIYLSFVIKVHKSVAHSHKISFSVHSPIQYYTVC